MAAGGLSRVALGGLAGMLLCVGYLASSPPALAAPPEIPITEPATEITTTSATLHGVLNPKTSATVHYHFIYSPEIEACESETTAEGEATGGPITVEQPLTGLQPGQKYTFCLVASNAEGESSTGAPLTFETAPIKALVEEESSSQVTQTTATLSASIDPELQETKCVALGFQYLDDATFKAEGYATALEAPCNPSEFFGPQEEPTGATLTGLRANTVYHYRVRVENQSGLTEGPDQTFLTLPQPPIVETTQASAIGATGATLAGLVNPGSEGPNSDTTYSFQYGFSAGYGNQTASGDAGQGTVPLPVTASIAGLEPGVEYHYRVLATNDSTGVPQTTYGVDRTFQTPATPPVLSPLTVSAVTSSGATFSAMLDPGGLLTRYELQLGATPHALQPAAVGSTTMVQPLSLSVTALSPGTVYYYRLTVSSANGTAESPAEGEGTFMTGTAPVASGPIVQPPTPALLPMTWTAMLEVHEAPVLKPAAGAASHRTARALSAALRACAKKPKPRRARCRRRARARYRKR